MCIIIAKNKDNRLPTEEELKNCFTRNNDGGGFMYVDNGQVVIDKGYMDYKSFIKRFKKLCNRYNNFENKSLVVHCRIGTASGNTNVNTHPYPISKNESDLHKLYFKTDLGVAHNGIISDYNPVGANPTTNDTQEFIMNFLTPMYENFKDFYKQEYMLKGLKKITNSKLAFLNKDDELFLSGDFVEHENLKFSNETYKQYQYNYSYGYSNNYSNGYSNWWNKKEKELEKETKKENKQFIGDNETLYALCEGDHILEIGTKVNYKVKLEDNLVYDYETGDVYEYDMENGILDLMFENTQIFDEKWNYLF